MTNQEWHATTTDPFSPGVSGSRNGTPNEMKGVQCIPKLPSLGPRADACRILQVRFPGVRRGASLHRGPRHSLCPPAQRTASGKSKKSRRHVQAFSPHARAHARTHAPHAPQRERERERETERERERERKQVWTPAGAFVSFDLNPAKASSLSALYMSWTLPRRLGPIFLKTASLNTACECRRWHHGHPP